MKHCFAVPCWFFNGLVSFLFVVQCEYFCAGTTTRRFVGHSKDVMSVAFSADNRQIVSASRDKTIKLWNTLGVCKYTIQVSFETHTVNTWSFIWKSYAFIIESFFI